MDSGTRLEARTSERRPYGGRFAPASRLIVQLENACRSADRVKIELSMARVEQFDRITVEPGKCAGKPCIRGMRITVRRVLELLVTYADRSALLADYPFLESEDLVQALQYAAATVDNEWLDFDRGA